MLQRFPPIFGAPGPMLRLLAVVCVASTLWLQGCDDASSDAPIGGVDIRSRFGG